MGLLKDAQAYTDDITIMFQGRRRKDIENQAASQIPHLLTLPRERGLQLSQGKSEALTLSIPKRLKHLPVTSKLIRINGISVKHVQNLKLLGLRYQVKLASARKLATHQSYKSSSEDA